MPIFWTRTTSSYDGHFAFSQIRTESTSKFSSSSVGSFPISLLSHFLSATSKFLGFSPKNDEGLGLANICKRVLLFSYGSSLLNPISFENPKWRFRHENFVYRRKCYSIFVSKQNFGFLNEIGS